MRLFEANKRNAITIFDVDDTLVVTRSKIKVHNPKTGFSADLTPQEFNTFKTRPNDKMDFSDFQSLDILKAGKIIEWVFSILKRTIQKGKAVGIITARDNSKLIQQFLSHNGININPISNSKQDIAALCCRRPVLVRTLRLSRIASGCAEAARHDDGAARRRVGGQGLNHC